MKDEELRTLPRFLVEQLRRDYPPPVLNSSKTFYREWIGPEGEESKSAPSDMLDNCRIIPAEPWGKLFFTVLPKNTQIRGRHDPLKVLKEANIRTSELKNALNGTNVAFKKEGKLAFIINEAVISPDSQYVECKKYHQALDNKARHLQNDDKHKIDRDSIPLIWFADNVGSFRVKVTVKPASTSPHM